MRQLKVSTARNVLVFMSSAVDHSSGLASLTLTITASKDGAAFASISPTVTDLGSGWYNLALTTTHTNTAGDLALHITSTGADPTDLVCQVVTDLPGATVSSVTGAVGSVTGAVGSVTGAVGSVTAGVTVTTNNDKTGYGLSAASVQAIWDALTSALTTVGSIGKLIVTNLDALISSRMATFSYTTPPTAIAIRTEMDSNSTKLANLDAAVSTRLAGASYTAPSNAAIAAIQAKTDNLPASPASTSDVTATLPIKKNTSFASFTFPMNDNAGVAATGLTVVAKRSVDGGALALCANAVTELTLGVYKIDFAASDLNGNSITFVMRATGASDTVFTVVPQ